MDAMSLFFKRFVDLDDLVLRARLIKEFSR